MYIRFKHILLPMLCLAVLGAQVTECISADTPNPMVAKWNPLAGKWIEKDNDGNQFLTEFTPTTLSSTPLDASGKPKGPADTVGVSYRKMGYKQGMGEGYAVDYRNHKDQWGNSGVEAYLKDPDTMLLDYPGYALHPLKRIK